VPADHGPRSPLGFGPWDHGRPRRSASAPPPVQVQSFGRRTWVRRQSKSVSYEAPFTNRFCVIQWTARS